MLSTLEGIQLLDKTDQLSEMILQSDIVEKYRACYHALKSDKEAQSKIQEFIRLKEQYEDVQRFGEYHPDYKAVMKKIREVKREMDLNSLVYEFKKAENDLQDLLDEIGVIVAHSVSKNIKVPSGNPFFANLSNCGDGCGSGGSCGCS